MRNILIFCFVLALVLVGKMAKSYEPLFSVPKNAFIERVANMTPLASTDNNAVEVDGIRFEIIVPERVWVIPENKPNTETHIKVNLRITNQNPEPVRFHRTTPILAVAKPDGLELRGSGGRQGPPYSQQFICRTFLPNESLIFSPNAKLLWHNNKLYFQGDDGGNGVWVYQGLQSGTYQIRFFFIGLISRAYCPDPNNPNPDEVELAEGFWTGQAVTPSVEVRLVAP